MGAIVAIMGEAGDPALAERLDRMLARSPYRGKPERHIEGGIAIAAQTRGWDASLATVGNWTVAMHGVIGNWPELAPAHGWDFPENASSATKLAIAYEDLGDALFRKLRGEFAVLIHDRSRNQVITVRDVWGHRPLFFERKGLRTFLATEIRQILTGSGSAVEIDGDVLINDILWRPFAPDRTHVKCVNRVHAGRVLRFSPTDHFEPVVVQEIWEPPEEQSGPYDMDSLAEELRSLIEQAVSRWFIGVPFAVSLSGGVDSSTVWWTISNAIQAGNTEAALGHPYTSSFPNHPYDESRQVKRILAATQSQGTLVEYAARNRIEAMLQNAARVDSPVHQIFSNCPAFTRRLNTDDRRLVLSGFGGDLILAGSLAYLIDLTQQLRLMPVFRDLLSYELPPSRSRLGFVTEFFTRPLGARIARLIRPRSRGPQLDWIHHSRALAIGPATIGSRPRGSNPPMSRHRRKILSTLKMRQSLAAQEGSEQFAASNGLTNGSPLIDLDLLDFSLRIQPRAWTDGKRKKQLLRMVAYNEYPEAVRTCPNPTPSALLDAAESGHLETLLPPENWVLVENEIVSAEALMKLFAKSKDNSNIAYPLLELAIAEAVVGRLPCIES